MSNAWINRVRYCSRSAGKARLVALLIADSADDDGVAFPGDDFLSRSANLSDKSVRDARRELTALHELEITKERRKGQAAVLRLTLPEIPRDGNGRMTFLHAAPTEPENPTTGTRPPVVIPVTSGTRLPVTNPERPEKTAMMTGKNRTNDRKISDSRSEKMTPMTGTRVPPFPQIQNSEPPLTKKRTGIVEISLDEALGQFLNTETETEKEKTRPPLPTIFSTNPEPDPISIEEKKAAFLRTLKADRNGHAGHAIAEPVAVDWG